MYIPINLDSYNDIFSLWKKIAKGCKKQWTKFGRVCKSGNTFVEGIQQLGLALPERCESNNVQKTLELGEGHGRDAMFFATKGIDIKVLDYLSEGIDT